MSIYRYPHSPDQQRAHVAHLKATGCLSRNWQPSSRVGRRRPPKGGDHLGKVRVPKGRVTY